MSSDRFPPHSNTAARASGWLIEGHFDEAARSRLKRNRTLATGLLVLMGVTFIGTHVIESPGFATMLLRSGAEAGIVGGFADWFAVTALFRHPLGLPIPHTAIVPSNKDRIARTLGGFVERNFLTEDVLLKKLREIHAGRRFAAWLAAPDTAPLIAGSLVGALPYLIRSLESRDLHDFAHRTLGEQLREADIAPILGRIVHALTASGEADILFERAVGIAARWLQDNAPQIDQLVQERSHWWIPRTMYGRLPPCKRCLRRSDIGGSAAAMYPAFNTAIWPLASMRFAGRLPTIKSSSRLCGSPGLCRPTVRPSCHRVEDRPRSWWKPINRLVLACRAQ
jgi:Protein of unknown function (DUF445)